LGRKDPSEAKLLGDAFSTKPPTDGHPRLRLGTDDGSDTFRSRHEGVGSFARGVYSAIRNPITRELDHELDKNQALEQLSVFQPLWLSE